MQPDDERSGPRQGRPPTPSTSTIVADPAAVDRSRRRWRLDRQRHRRRVVGAFDRWAVDHYGPDAARAAGIRYGATESVCSCCCHEPPDHGDYWREVGMTLGWPERQAAGLALRERAA